MTKSTLRSGRSRNSLALFFGLLIVLTSTLEAGSDLETRRSSRPLTLHECIAIALGESPSLEASRYDVASAAEEVRAAQGLTLPLLTGSAEAVLFSGSPTSKFTVVNQGEATGTGVGLNLIGLGAVEIYSAHLKYPVFKDGSLLGLNNPPAVAEKKAKRQELAWTVNLRREDIIYRITDEFIATVSARNRAGLAERRVKLLEQSVNITQEQQKQGLMLPIDLKVAKDALNGAQSLSKILREQAVAGSLALSESLGLPSTSRIRLEETLPEPPSPPTTEQLLGASLKRHPSVQVQQAVAEQAKQDYRLQRYRLYPSVSLDGSALYIDDFSPANASVFTGALTVSIPIFDFGAQHATAQSKLMKYKSEQAKVLSTADDVTYDVLKVYQSIYSVSQNILSLQDEVSKAQRDFQVYSSQQQQGITPPLTAIEKELHLIAKRDDLEVNEARRLTLYASLQKAAGGMWKWSP